MKFDPQFLPPSIYRGLIRAGSVRITFWFVVIAIAACIPLWAVVAWRGTEPGPMEILLRGVLALCSFAAGIVTFLWMIARRGRLPNS
ncbi:MAG: hypothetical protein L0211_20930 [Planctomycetaceae bacterium]|nr:hypothetical protein [Planctomycetaceae bacterium]